MSFLTGTNTELIYASTAAGLTQASFTTEQSFNTSATMGVVCHLPPDFWLPNNNAVGRGIKVLARGVYGTSTAAPLLNFNIRGGAAGAITNNLLAATLVAGVTPASAAAVASYWEAEADIILSAISAAGANSTVRSYGRLAFGGLGGTALSMFPLFGAGIVAGTALMDTSITNYININWICGTSNASNTITLNSLEVWGLN